MTDKLKLLILGGAALILVILVVIAFGFGRRERGGGIAVRELTMWGVADSESEMQDFLLQVLQLTGVQVHYRQIPEGQYERTLLEALAAGRGPDIFAIRNSWVPKHGNKIFPAPPELLNPRVFQEIFIDGVFQDLVFDNKVWGLSFYIDTLGLFYNRGIFNSEGVVSPPGSWDEFLRTVTKLTQLDKQGNITRSGAALGRGDNVDKAPDILMMLMIQSGAQMIDFGRGLATFDQAVFVGNQRLEPGLSALIFYTDFANPGKAAFSWPSTMASSIDFFAQGRVGMMLNTAATIKILKAKSPQLNFGTAEIPQVRGAPVKVSYPNYWAFSVNTRSPNRTAAWQVLVSAVSPPALQVYFNSTGRVSSHRQLISQQFNDPFLGPFARQALSARSWYQVDKEAIDDIFRAMISSVVNGQRVPSDALRLAADQVTQLMK